MAGTSRNEIAWIVDEKECWVCTSHKANNGGYCATLINGKQTALHRFHFEKYKHKIPEGQTVSQICGNRKCINPDHLRCGFAHYHKRIEPKWEIDKNGCWNVTSHKANSKGYVSLNRSYGDGKKLLHRIHYEKYKGVIPEGLIIRHTCDNRLCVNPDHLITGTFKDNAMDAVERGRTLKGEKANMAKLTDKDVREILKSNEKYKVLAKRYNVHKGHIGHIKQGLLWKHIER